MQQQFYDEYENDNGQDQNSNLVKDLRAQIKKANEDLKAAQATISDQSKAIRERTVADVLAAKGVPSKVAKLVPADIEASEGAVSKWLEDYSDLFTKPETTTTEQQNQQNDNAGGSGAQNAPADELAARRMQNATTGGSAVTPRLDDLINQVQKADPATLLAMIQASKNGA